MKPRRRYYVSISTGLCVLAVASYALHWYATTARQGRLRRQIEALEARVDALERYRAKAEDDFLHARQIGDASNISKTHDGERPAAVPRLRPRLLGSGKSGKWAYSDLRFPSGCVRRYYVRREASTPELVRLAATIRSDLADDLVLSETFGE